jgi:hypothetical protein
MQLASIRRVIAREDHAVISPEPRMPTRMLFFALLRFEGSHINREAVLHIGLAQSLVGFGDLLDRDDFDIGGDVVCAAEIEHFLGLVDAADSSLKNLADPGVRCLLNHVKQLVALDGHIKVWADGLSFANAFSHPRV